MLDLRLAVCLVCFASLAPAQFNVTLKPKTVEAFDSYRKQAESQMTWRPRFSVLAPGSFKVEPTNGSPTHDVPAGLVHDWVGASVAEGATVQQVLAVLQDYPAYQRVYAPDVLESRLLRQEGQTFHAYLKLVKKKVLTAVLNSEFAAEFRRFNNSQWNLISRSTRMVELDGNREKKEGTGYGFLWRLNAYWIIQQRGSDVYLECRSLSLSRDIPYGTGFVVRPFVSELPRESLTATLRQTIAEIRARFR